MRIGTYMHITSFYMNIYPSSTLTIIIIIVQKTLIAIMLDTVSVGYVLQQVAATTH